LSSMLPSRCAMMLNRAHRLSSECATFHGGLQPGVQGLS
jgi:hypothetical protein